MSYELALEAAGARVIASEYFGSYQGDWIMLVEYMDTIGWINGSYGSCSGCDAFEGEFGFGMSHEHQTEFDGYNWVSHSSLKEYYDPDCEDCKNLQQRLSEFGKEYLSSLMSQAEIEAHCKRNIGWDLGAQEMLNFVLAHTIESTVTNTKTNIDSNIIPAIQTDKSRK